MAGAAEIAKSLVHRFESDDAGVLKLATLAALAVHIEAELLRALRLGIVPRLSSATEADLWFSPLVHSRGPDGIAFLPEMSALLRERLRTVETRHLERAWSITERYHRTSSPAIRLEEKVAWLALSVGEAAEARIERELARALGALIREDRRGLAAWAQRALPRLPMAARATPFAWLLGMAAAHRLGRRPQLAGEPPEALRHFDLTEFLGDLDEVELLVRRQDQLVELGQVQGSEVRSIKVPASEPRIVELRWRDGDQEHRQVVAVGSQEVVRREVGPGALRLRSSSGAIYELPADRRDDSLDVFWDELLVLIEEGRVVPIVGQDLLTVRRDGRDVPLYRWLAGRLADALEVSGEDLPASGELNAVACRFLEQGGKWQRLYSALKVVMPSDDELAVPESLRQLAGIEAFRLFVTTTFDPLLERAIEEARSADRRAEVLAFSPYSSQDLPTDDLDSLGRTTVYHLFGRLSATPTYAVTEEDTLEFVHALMSQRKRPQLLLDVLEHKQLLILGVGFDGWLLRFLLRAMKGRLLRSLRFDAAACIADRSARDDQDLRQFLRSFGGSMSIFDQSGARELVGELYRRWTERQPMGRPESEVAPAPSREPGFVFLSYASEDREAAERLGRALEDAGIDVLIDTQDLKAGEDWEAKLKRAIRDCSLFVPLISEHTLTARRRFFRREWSLALDEASAAAGRFIVPVAVDDTSPEEVAIPDAFRRIHWEHAPGGRASRELVDRVATEYRKYQKHLWSSS